MFVIGISKWHDMVLSQEEDILTGKTELFLFPSQRYKPTVSWADGLFSIKSDI